MEGAPTSRRTYVIDRGFQLKYSIMLAVLGGVVSALYAALTYLAHLDVQRDLPHTPEVQEELARADLTLITLLVALSLLMAGAMGLVGVLITHRVAGPIFVMSHYVSVLSRGRYPLLRRLRKGDELKVFFERFGEAVEAMRAREAGELETLRQAIAALEPGAATEPAKDAVQQLRALADRKQDATDTAAVGR